MVSGFANFQHTTTPQSNTVLTGTTALTQDTRTFQASYSQNFLYGLSANLTYSSNYIKVNSQFFNLNPFTNGSLDLQVTQPLLQGFGTRRERPQYPGPAEQHEGERPAVQTAGLDDG